MRIIVLMTCYNRRVKTLACLAALYRNFLPLGAEVAVVLVDDGSTDGTADAVRAAHFDVQIVRGNGALFWNGGMRLAWETAQALPYDYLLWLNDDTLLHENAIERLLATASFLYRRLGHPVITVGSTCGPECALPTYGGLLRRIWYKPLHFELVHPGRNAVPCHTMNGNCVLVPREISLEVGNLDHRFVHAMGDIDYGLRAQAIGYSVWVIPGYAGTCLNDNVGLENSFSDPALPLCVRMRRILSPKALPPRAWFVLTRRHAGWLWPLQWAWPYLKVMGTAIAHSVLHPIASRGKQK